MRGVVRGVPGDGWVPFWHMLCTGLTASASPFMFLPPSSNTLHSCPFLRTEAFHAGVQLGL